MEAIGHHAAAESGRQDSNLRSSAPKADALATTLRPGFALPARRPMVECRAPARAYQRRAAVIRLEPLRAVVPRVWGGLERHRRIAAASGRIASDGLHRAPQESAACPAQSSS